MCDLSVRLFGKAAMKETRVLPVVRFLGFRALRTSLVLIYESIFFFNFQCTYLVIFFQVNSTYLIVRFTPQ